MLAVEQEFTQQFIDAGFFPLNRISFENGEFDPTLFEGEWCEIKYFGNDVTPLTLNSLDDTDGFFQAILHYPTGTLSIDAKKKAEQIMKFFHIGKRMERDGVKIAVARTQKMPSTSGASSYDLIVRIFFIAAMPR